jgi:hypothetical protein
MMKVGSQRTEDAEREFDLSYCASLDTATRFRMSIERSI